ncbi:MULTISPECIES: DUF1223 domain-containing protein [Flavobacteriaceae]|uniref:DUF1223 domain-containing protein n=1 Tax=Flavobacteriaceae TaxID=49546 RepID=UPI00149206A1|nr:MULTISPECIES: DUF1223 domain-containing protein [Allomuricauda]MDC6366898.1 DUF1223 domain-containing protein [Muricauda sp. AC10]
MPKKILFPSFVFFGISLIALYATKVEGKGDEMSILKKEVKTVEEGIYKPVVVLELFTSQGCSSCPPADILLEKAKKQFPKEVFALSYHVDYWNYIGWEDPFSKSIYTKKQQQYNRKFRYGSNYTPQLVVNGKEHFVGSNRSQMTSKISIYKTKKAENEVELSHHTLSGKTLEFDFNVKGNLDGKQLRAVVVLDERITSVKRGENRNRVLKNSNIVIAEKYIPLQSAKGKNAIHIPSIVAKNEGLTLMLLVEAGNLDIIAAVKTSVQLP